jgi:hypothetical protein
LTGQIHQDCYWKFWDLRPQLIRELEQRTTILASAINSKYVSFRRVPTGNVYNKKTKLYFIDTWWEFAVLQSSFHQEWAFWTCGTLGASTINYSTSSALETWPMPTTDEDRSELERLGKEYHAMRERILLEGGFGLTKVYNRFHDPNVVDEEIEQLRRRHVEMDRAVARAYGWEDTLCVHGFFDVGYLPENDRVRFTLSDSARRIGLRRLADLNLHRQRYEDPPEPTANPRLNGRAKATLAGQGALALVDAQSDEPSGTKTATPAKRVSTRRTKR